MIKLWGDKNEVSCCAYIRVGAQHHMDYYRENLRMVLWLRNTLSFPRLVTQLMRNAYVPTIDVVDKYIQTMKVKGMTIIKDMRNSTAPTWGFQISNIVRGSPASDILVSDSTTLYSLNH